MSTPEDELDAAIAKAGEDYSIAMSNLNEVTTKAAHALTEAYNKAKADARAAYQQAKG